MEVEQEEQLAVIMQVRLEQLTQEEVVEVELHQELEELAEESGPIGVQLFDYRPAAMAEAAKRAKNASSPPTHTTPTQKSKSNRRRVATQWSGDLAPREVIAAD